MPKGCSPHVCTDMKGQAVKPARDMSCGRRASRVDRVPEGDVRWICRSPRLDDTKLILA